MLSCTIISRRPLFYSDMKALETKELILRDPSWNRLEKELEEQSDQFFYTIGPKTCLTTSTVLKRLREYLGKDLVHIEWIRPGYEEQFIDCYIETRSELKGALKRLREILGGKNFIVCAKAYDEYCDEPDAQKGFVARILLLGLLDQEYIAIRGRVLQYAAYQAFGCSSAVATHIE